MTADEMFEKLGYEKEEDENFISYAIIKEISGYEILFNLRTKEVESWQPYYNIRLNAMEIKAINQKCKELEWIE